MWSFLLGNLSGILLGSVGLAAYMAYTTRWEQAIDPEEVERVAMLIWDGYGSAMKATRTWGELRYNVRDAFRSAARAVLVDLKTEQSEPEDAVQNLYIEQTLQHIVGILHHQSRLMTSIADHLAAGDNNAAIADATAKLRASQTALQAAVEAAKPAIT